MSNETVQQNLKLGWAQETITPEAPVLVAGLFHARLSERIMDPLTVTALAIESGSEQVVLVSCDLIQISGELRKAVHVCLCQAELAIEAVGLDPAKVVLNATHTHTAPIIDSQASHTVHISGCGNGLNLEASKVQSYIVFVADQIAKAVARAWTKRALGGIAFGQEFAVVGFNRRWVDKNGRATMYGSDAQDRQLKAAKEQDGDTSFYGIDPSVADSFRHIEGYEDHSIQIVAAYDLQGDLTGLVVNVPCPSQESEDEFALSADWWHETRLELRRRFGEHVFILPQCSAAGDLSPHLLYGGEAQSRMLALKGRTTREEIAHRIAYAVESAIPFLGQAIEWQPVLKHRSETVELEANRLAEQDVQSAQEEAAQWQRVYEQERAKLDLHPELLNKPHWYVDATYAYGRMCAYRRIVDRFEQQKLRSTIQAELCIIRLGNIAFATQPFECYLDFGIQIKLRNPAIQTFLIQLAGAGTYLPSPRSVYGGGYGSTPASNPIGPEGGQQLVEHTVRMIRSLWADDGLN
ncbi:MAG: hypothetical protein K0R67_3530 [Paenibacillus sp.]|jgi:hypothetical protein|nr:hypothetical protein [Paenibacillus sp.]